VKLMRDLSTSERKKERSSVVGTTYIFHACAELSLADEFDEKVAGCDLDDVRVRLYSCNFTNFGEREWFQIRQDPMIVYSRKAKSYILYIVPDVLSNVTVASDNSCMWNRR
jgi:hypothetical protein